MSGKWNKVSFFLFASGYSANLDLPLINGTDSGLNKKWKTLWILIFLIFTLQMPCRLDLNVTSIKMTVFVVGRSTAKASTTNSVMRTGNGPSAVGVQNWEASTIDIKVGVQKVEANIERLDSPPWFPILGNYLYLEYNGSRVGNFQTAMLRSPTFPPQPKYNANATSKYFESCRVSIFGVHPRTTGFPWTKRLAKWIMISSRNTSLAVLCYWDLLCLGQTT